MADFTRVAELLRARGISTSDRTAIMVGIRAAMQEEEAEIEAGRPAATERDLMLAAARESHVASLAKLAAATARRLGVTIPNSGVTAALLDSQLAGKDVRTRIELKKMLSDLNLIR
jgi:hypothetical protein